MLFRLFHHSQAGGPLVLLHEIDLCIVGIASLSFGGAHHTSLAVGSMEATTHVINLNIADDGYLEPPQVPLQKIMRMVIKDVAADCFAGYMSKRWSCLSACCLTPTPD